MVSDIGTMPARIAALPRDRRGIPIPWFVAWVPGPDGPVPEFRAADGRKFTRAVRERRCWVCGEPLGRWLAFILGPMCVITRTTAEPPMHRECAEWSALNCPFLVEPRAVRREQDLPTQLEKPGGFPILRNPGVAAIWITRSFEVFNAGGGKPLLTVGDAESVTWWRETRPATRDEVDASIAGGMPALLVAAKVDGPFAVEELGKQAKRAERWYPPVALGQEG
jgi:hypothetical protein